MEKNIFKWDSLNINSHNLTFQEVDDNSDFLKLRTENTAEKASKQASGYYCTDRIRTIVEDNVYEEAHNIVKNWMTKKKVFGEYDDRNSFLRLSTEEDADIRLKLPTKVEIHREWDHLIEKIDQNETYKDDLEAYLNDNRGYKEDPKLQNVLKNLHEKTFINAKKLRAVDKVKPVDHLTNIESRHEEVRKRKAERDQMEEQKRAEKLAEKEARFEVVKHQKEEKKLRELKLKKEEELIQMEMNKVRAELQKQREFEALERKRLKEAEILLAKHQQQSSARNQIQTETDQLQIQIANSAQNRVVIMQNLVDQKINNYQRKIKQICFSTWRNLVYTHHYKYEKAALWCDWFRLRQSFRHWCQLAQKMKLDRQLQRDQYRMIQIKKKEEMAIAFYKKKLLKKCLFYWSLFVVDSKENRWCEKLEEMRKKKMMDYIDSLKAKVIDNQTKISQLSMKTSNSQVEEEEEEHSQPQPQISSSDSPQSHRPQTTNMARRLMSSARPQTSSGTNKRAKSARREVTVPKEAWQVNRNHVNMPLDKLFGHSIQNKKQCEEPIKSLKYPKPKDNYANRNVAQQEIIEIQQEKIKEQERVIEQLQCMELLKSMKKDLVSKKNELTNEENEVLSPTSILSEDRNTGSVNQESSRISNEPQIVKTKDKFVIKMEERAKEREKIKAERLGRKRLAEEERKKQLEEQLAEHERIENEQRLEKERLQKEKRHKEKLKELAKVKKQHEQDEKNRKADEYYKGILMKTYGIQRWHKLLLIKQSNYVKADAFYKNRIYKLIFCTWLADYRKEKVIENKLVYEFHSKILLRTCFHHFKLFKHRMLMLTVKAEEHHGWVVTRKYFMAWRLYNHRQQIRLDKLNEEAVHIYNRNLLKMCLELWKQVPMAIRQERERERRLRAMREKVSTLIPDFTHLSTNDSIS